MAEKLSEVENQRFKNSLCRRYASDHVMWHIIVTVIMFPVFLGYNIAKIVDTLEMLREKLRRNLSELKKFLLPYNVTNGDV